MNCDILKSKLILCECNAFYFIEIAVIGFTLDEIKQCIVFFGTPGIVKIVQFILKYINVADLQTVSQVVDQNICMHRISLQLVVFQI